MLSCRYCVAMFSDAADLAVHIGERHPSSQLAAETSVRSAEVSATAPTSALLRQTEMDRDDWKAYASRLVDDLARVEAERDAVRVEEQEWRNVAHRAVSARDEARQERDLAQAELASARQELEQLRRYLNQDSPARPAPGPTEGEPHAQIP